MSDNEYVGQIVCGVKHGKKSTKMYARFVANPKRKIKAHEWSYPVFRHRDGVLMAVFPDHNMPLDCKKLQIKDLPKQH